MFLHRLLAGGGLENLEVLITKSRVLNHALEPTLGGAVTPRQCELVDPVLVTYQDGLSLPLARDLEQSPLCEAASDQSASQCDREGNGEQPADDHGCEPNRSW